MDGLMVDELNTFIFFLKAGHISLPDDDEDKSNSERKHRRYKKMKTKMKLVGGI